MKRRAAHLILLFPLFSSTLIATPNTPGPVPPPPPTTLKLAKPPTCGALGSAGLGLSYSLDKLYKSAPGVSNYLPKEIRWRSLELGATTVKLDYLDSQVDLKIFGGRATFSEDEVTTPANLYPPTPLVRADSKAQTLHLRFKSPTHLELEKFASFVGSFGDRVRPFEVWVGNRMWRHSEHFKLYEELDHYRIMIHVEKLPKEPQISILNKGAKGKPAPDVPVTVPLEIRFEISWIEMTEAAKAQPNPVTQPTNTIRRVTPVPATRVKPAAPKLRRLVPPPPPKK